MALSRITEAVASFTDLTIGDDLTLTDDLLMASDANIIKFGADADVTLTHVHNTGLLLNSTSVIQFNDASQNIGAPNATTLDINATDEIELNATLVDVNANLDVSGTIVSGGTLTATTSIGIGSAVLTEAELEFLDGITAGTAAASKALILDGSTNITGIGTIGSGAITSSSTIQGTTITATTAFVPDASDGAALGTSSLEFSDLFLADAAVINLGADQDTTLTHVADTGILLNSSRKIQFGDSATFIQQSSDGVMRIDGEATINLNASSNVDVSNDIRLRSDASVLSFGADSDVTLTHVADTGILLNSTMAIQFNDASQFINAPSATVLDINATDEIELNATLVDVNANINVSGTYTGGGLLTTGGNIVIPDAGNIGSASDTDAIAIASNGAVTLTQALSGTSADFDGGVTIDNITIDGTEIDLSSGNLTVDVAGAILLDADVGNVQIHDAGTEIGRFANSSSDFVIKSAISDKDMIFKGNDGGSEITALTLDMSAAGDATFNQDIYVRNIYGASDGNTGIQWEGSDVLTFHTGGAENIKLTSGAVIFNEDSADMDFRVEGNGDANALFVQGSNDRVGIGTNSPNSKLSISEGGNTGGLLELDETDAANLAGYMQFDSNGTNKANIQNANNAGIHLCVGTGGTVTFTALGYTAANALDDYEEGTWTPAFQSTNATFSYASQGGTYTKVGRLIMASFRLQLSGSPGGTTSNSVVVSGLPFNSASLEQTYHGGAFGHYFGFNLSQTGVMAYQTATGGATVELKVVGDNLGETGVLASHLNSTAQIRGQIIYHTA